MANRAGFASRLGAYIIDAILMYTIQFILLTAFDVPMTPPEGAGLDWVLNATPMHVNLLINLLVLGYILIEGLTGASPGKRLLGLVIGTTQGQRGDTGLLLTRIAIKYSAFIPGFLAIFLAEARPLLMAVSAIMGLIVLAGCTLALGSRRQALHDLIAKSAVYRAKDLR